MDVDLDLCALCVRPVLFCDCDKSGEALKTLARDLGRWSGGERFAVGDEAVNP